MLEMRRFSVGIQISLSAGDSANIKVTFPPESEKEIEKGLAAESKAKKIQEGIVEFGWDDWPLI